MADSKAWTEVLRRVGHTEDGGVLEVGLGDDFTGVVIRCPDDISKEYWGDINITMRAEFARRLGEALIAAAAEAREGW